MARPFVKPDPKDRSVNEPTYLVTTAQVLGLYNQDSGESKKERVVDSVKDWYTEQMCSNGWKKAVFHGSQCLLEASVKLD